MSLVALVSSQIKRPVPKCNLETLKYFKDSVKFHVYPSRETKSLACNDEIANYMGCCETESLRELMKKIVKSDALR